MVHYLVDIVTQTHIFTVVDDYYILGEIVIIPILGLLLPFYDSSLILQYNVVNVIPLAPDIED